jgi:ketosteroid isomerase-like protein
MDATAQLKEVLMADESMEKRLRRLEDIEAIKQMHLEYTYALMAMQYDRMLEYFAEDGVLELGPNPVKGKKAIGGVFQNVLAKHSTLKDGHIVAQPVITVDGDTAKGHWLLFIFPPTEPKGEWVQGRQEVEYARVGGQWKIKRMKFLRGWPQPEAATHQD